MQRFSYLGIGLAATLAASSSMPVHAQAAAAPVKDAASLEALSRMGTYLRSLKAFQVKVATSTEDVMDDGQKLLYSGVTDLLAQTPARLRAEVTSDRQHRTYFYDGKSFTLFAQRLGYYATVPAPPTTAELVERLDEKYGVEIPLVDLFYWGGPKSSAADITGAMDAGPAEVDGVSCQHYAFRQPGLDWQVWIQLGDYPLPRKLVLTTTNDDARPTHTAVYTWNLAPSFNDAAFTFVPPDDARKIVFAEIGAAGAAKK